MTENCFAVNWQLVRFGFVHPSIWSATNHWLRERGTEFRQQKPQGVVWKKTGLNSGQADHRVKLKMQLASWATQVDINRNFSQ